MAFLADSLEIKPGDKVLEIGPGLGFLTRFLVQRKASVLGVELDRDCVQTLNAATLGKYLNVTHGDFLDFDIGTAGSALKIAGNVPYQITTPIVAHIFGEIGEPQPWLANVEKVTLTVQLEVAQRFVATPGSDHYSQITLLINYFSTAKLLRKVDRENFFPIPDVTSAIVEFVPLREPPVQCKDHKLLRQVIRSGFKQRRKMFKNNLAFLQIDDDTIHDSFLKAHINPQARAENLSLEQFAALTDVLVEVDMRKRNHD